MTDRMTAAFRAGFVRRWHMNPDLSHVTDRIDGHSARVARIILMLNPDPSVSLLKAALIHDDGESATGDVCGEVKRKNPKLAAMLDVIEAEAREAIWGADADLTDVERQWLKFADRLDGYMWADFHAPHVMGGDGWPEARARLLNQAVVLGCDISGAFK